MTRSAIAVAPRALGADLAGTAASVVMLVVLVTLLAWPLADVFIVGLLVVPPPPAVIANTLAAAVAAMLGALGMAGILAAAVRFDAPGREGLVAIGRAGMLVPPFVVPLGLLVLVGRDRLGLTTIAVAQAFAFLPHAFALVMRALAGVSAEAEQAAELLGASHWTVLRRVTLGLARPGLAAAALVVLGLCLADVTSPLLAGGQGLVPAEGRRMVLAGFVVMAGAHWPAAMNAGAVALAVLTVAVALAGRTWRYVTAPLVLTTVPRAGMRPLSSIRAGLATIAWLVMAALVTLWAAVPIASLIAAGGGWHLSLAHWTGSPGVGRPLVHSLVLGLGVAVVGTLLALAVAWLAERRRGGAAGAMTALARLPVAVAGLVGGVGYLQAFGAHGDAFLLVVLLVAAWELPVMLRVAGNALARSDRSREQAALTLGAGPVTTLRRVVLPALNPAVLWLLCHGFAAGVAAVGTVVILAEQVGLELGVMQMLVSASTGSLGAACAVATVLLAIAGGATRLGRAVAGRESVPTLLA
jgi:iron(III) transport system permease protein